MLEIDNSADGNCMYYAYSISLMYYLRAKNDPAITSDIFNKLKLSEENRASLNKLLLMEPSKQFTKNEIKTVIEPILGKATRDLAADRTVEEFIAKPEATSLFSAAQYGLEYHLKQILKIDHPELADVIDNDFKNKNFTEAEIYRTPNIDQAMEEFVKNNLSAMIALFKQEWPKKKDSLEHHRKAPSEKDVNFYKSLVFNTILQKKTVEFFLENKNQNLNSYKERLQQNYVWGTEETLMILHRAIQGEQIKRNSKGTIDTVYDTKIVLHIYKNGSPPHLSKDELANEIITPKIIINNIPGHWKSLVQPTRLINKILNEMVEAYSNIPKHLEEYEVARNLLTNLCSGIGIIDPINSKSLQEKERAVSKMLADIDNASLKLGDYQSWGTLFKNFLSTLLDWIPTLLGEDTIRSGLETWGLYKADRRPEITVAIERVTNKLLDAIEDATNATHKIEETVIGSVDTSLV